MRTKLAGKVPCAGYALPPPWCLAFDHRQKMTLENYKAIADSIALLLYPHAEVIVHELRSQTVVHIANNFSQRELGDDSAIDHELADLLNGVNLGPYESSTGTARRSVPSVLCCATRPVKPNT